MKRSTRILLAALATAAAVLGSFADLLPAKAATTTYTPSITVDATPQVGVPVQFSTDADCNVNRCQWSWSWYHPTQMRFYIGGQIGEGQAPSYTFTPDAATHPYVIVKVKVTSAGGTNKFVLGQRAFVLSNTPAPLRSNYLTGCSSQLYTPYGSGSSGVLSSCTGHANNGGLNQQRAVADCYHGGVYQYRSYGAWVGEGVYSSAECGPNPTNGWWTATRSYQLR